MGGGLTGVVLANSSLDLVPRHILCCGSFPLRLKNRCRLRSFSSLCKLVPANDRDYYEPLFPIHFLGLAGIPRRYSDFPDFYIGFNFLARVGSIISIFSVVLLLFTLWEAWASNRPALTVISAPRRIEFR